MKVFLFILLVVGFTPDGKVDGYWSKSRPFLSLGECKTLQNEYMESIKKDNARDDGKKQAIIDLDCLEYTTPVVL